MISSFNIILIIITLITFLFFKLFENNNTVSCNYESNKCQEFYRIDHVSNTRNLNHHFYDNCKKHIFNNYEHSDEVPERLSAYLFIEPNDKVLEIGGNIGGVSAIIADKLKNSRNLVVVEPSDIAVENLSKISYKHDFNVYHGVIVAENKNLECKLTHGNYFACENVDYKVKNNITFNELQEKYNIIFDTLVIDCEGCYEDLFSDGFEKGWFDNIKKIIIEWDGRDFEKVILDKGFYFISYLPHANLEKGVRVYFR